MAELKFLDTIRNTADQIKTDTRTYVSRVYKRANTLFTEASPFAQIISVFSELYELIMFYIEDCCRGTKHIHCSTSRVYIWYVKIDRP